MTSARSSRYEQCGSYEILTHAWLMDTALLHYCYNREWKVLKRPDQLRQDWCLSNRVKFECNNKVDIFPPDVKSRHTDRLTVVFSFSHHNNLCVKRFWTFSRLALRPTSNSGFHTEATYSTIGRIHKLKIFLI